MRALNSPGIDVCTLDAATQSCIGCGRTLAEIEGWIAFTPGQRSAINAELPARRARFEALRRALRMRRFGFQHAVLVRELSAGRAQGRRHVPLSRMPCRGCSGAVAAR